MVFGYIAPDYRQLARFTTLTYQFSQTMRNRPFQHFESILGYPHKVVFYITLPDKTANKGFKLFDISLLGLPLVLSFGTEAKFSMISTAWKKTKDTLSVDVFTDLLKQNLPKVHKARLRAVALFVLSLISEATVNLQKLALSGLTAVQPDSVCKRFSRLLIWVASAKIDLGKLILKLTPLPDTSEFILCMDRTNWKYGKRHINFLVLSLYVIPNLKRDCRT